jgi:hypothetical protein
MRCSGSVRPAITVTLTAVLPAGAKLAADNSAPRTAVIGGAPRAGSIIVTGNVHTGAVVSQAA